jgi:leader peptidase (prepilin peptidase)/N-methyltransferase
VILTGVLAAVGAAGSTWIIVHRVSWWGLRAGAAVGRRVRLATVIGAAVLAGLAGVRGDLTLAAALWAGALAGGADLACREIPHRWVAVMAVAGVYQMAVGQVAVIPAVAATAAIGAFFLAVHLVTRSGLGLGDVKLSVGIALALGWPQALTATVLGLWAGGLWAALILITRRAERADGIPLGPFLVLGMAVAALLTVPG